jgi:hypothetical protein
MNQERTTGVAEVLAAELLADRAEGVSGPPNDWQRFAVVFAAGWLTEAYLPGGYEVVGTISTRNSDGRWHEATLIAGHDVAGWTLDDYVIPRLASGLHVALEVTPRG